VYVCVKNVRQTPLKRREKKKKTGNTSNRANIVKDNDGGAKKKSAGKHIIKKQDKRCAVGGAGANGGWSTVTTCQGNARIPHPGRRERERPGANGVSISRFCKGETRQTFKRQGVRAGVVRNGKGQPVTSTTGASQEKGKSRTKFHEKDARAGLIVGKKEYVRFAGKRKSP